MDEAAWECCDEPEKMLHFVQGRGKLSERKARLFAVACCRLLLPLLGDERSRHALDVTERVADNLALKHEELYDAFNAATAASNVADNGGGWAGSAAAFAVKVAADHVLRLDSLSEFVAEAVGCRLGEAWDPTSWRAACQIQCSLLRDLLGPLSFRSLPSVPASVLSWNDGCVVKLATAIYEGRECTQEWMGVLADALEDAGMTDQEVLRHCRQEGAVHVRGCWVTDLLLGKS
jgi:hypothetical protein